MRDVSLWRCLLGVEESVIEGVKFDPAACRVVVSARPAARRRGRCGRCRAPSPGYDAGRGRRRWRALDLGTVQAFIEAAAPRVRCRAHGVVVAHVPWARHGAGSTHGFEQQIAWLATQASKSTVTTLMRVAWRTVGAIISRVWADVEAGVDLLEIAWNSVVESINGELSVESITVKDTKTGELRDLECAGLFIAIGHIPRSELLTGQVDLDDDGYVLTKDGTTATNIEGVFAAGDLVDHVYRQAITAAGTGCQAALDAEKFLAHQAHAEAAAVSA